MARKTRDPLIAAMIAKLPDGGEWPVDRQLAWLNLMAMAFGTVYGGDAAVRIGSMPKVYPPHVTFGKIDALPARDGSLMVYPFYIDHDGKAKNQHGKPVKASEVKGDLVDLRGQSGDMKTIQWADGSTGLGGADLTIVAA